MAYQIDPNKCMACGTCVGICPVMAIAMAQGGKYEIDPKKCINCGTCTTVCPVMAISPAVAAPAAPVTPKSV